MTYRGHVKNGAVVLDDPAQLQEGAAVEIRVIAAQQEPSVWQRILKFAGTVEGLPSDFARNHDHYLYGVPKK